MAADWSAVRSTGRPTLAVSVDHQCATDRRIGRVVDGDGRRSLGAAGPPPGDHAELEREQLVEGQPPQRRVAPFE